MCKSPNLTNSRWLTGPGAVWQDMKGLNDAFVAALERDLNAGKTLKTVLKGTWKSVRGSGSGSRS